MIQPTIGRKVWFYEADQHGNINNRAMPFDATIVYVWSPECVNLRISDHVGLVLARSSVVLRDPDDGDRHGSGSEFATWMPYQVKTAQAAP